MSVWTSSRISSTGCRRAWMAGFSCVAMGLLSLSSMQAQQPPPRKPSEVKVTGGFIEDSLLIGKPVRFYLTARYPQELNMLFPDSTYNFAPFEFESKRYVPTETKQGFSYDSVIYDVSTFEVDRRQMLNLSIFQLNKSDCTVYKSPVDTILVTQLVNFAIDTIDINKLPIRANAQYHDVAAQFNYPVMLMVLAVIAVLATVGWFVFGKRIRKHFRMKNMLAAHRKFLESYTQELSRLRSAFSTVTTEAALVHWKIYMEQLEARPYTKLTTREARTFLTDESVIQNLQQIDGAIYGHISNVVEPLEHLKQVADKHFQAKLQEVKHG
jgi:hypothetical protein